MWWECELAFFNNISCASWQWSFSSQVQCSQQMGSLSSLYKEAESKGLKTLNQSIKQLYSNHLLNFRVNFYFQPSNIYFPCFQLCCSLGSIDVPCIFIYNLQSHFPNHQKLPQDQSSLPEPLGTSSNLVFGILMYL